MELRDKVCLIAGGSGTIGAAVARHFQREGAHLALTCQSGKPKRSEEALLETSAGARWYPLDVTDRDQVQDTVDRVSRDLGGIDVLVNCTGVIGPIGPIEALDIEQWVRAIEINFLGSVHLARAVLPLMKQRGRGKLIFFSGGGAAYGRAYFTSYSSSKAALVRFTESLAQELQTANIQVNAVAPGPVESRMWEEMRSAGNSGGPKLVEELSRMRKTGGVSPDLAAGLTVFLASDRSDRITGRLLSAVWDDWEHLDGKIEKIASSDAWTLRRVSLT
jgi:NAD(P)-dependent dehydrogenase (short-subunit alcohol dehydrogenase family)